MTTWLTKSLIIFLVFLSSWSSLSGQAPKKWTSADIQEAIQKLNFLGSALYVAAHPDDENTRLIAYLSNEVKAETAYLSITRGDGGQNLVGAEIQELLGVIRTQELLAARRIDGGVQFFTRATDFGYSKHPDETFDIWNREEVLADVVWAIRKWQPDIVINRFNHRTPGSTHGHHTASAVLSAEAFELVNDPKAFPKQLNYVDTWQPRRLFFNTSWWFYGSQENFEKADKSNLFEVDAGVYYPIKGKSNAEIAALSRSMHKSQGFGSSGARGSEPEYLELIEGDMPDKEEGLFAGINTSWTRVKGGEPIGKILGAVEKAFNYQKPYESVPELLKAYDLIKALPDGHWKRLKQVEIEEVIQACLGLFAEAVAADVSATPGEQVGLELEIINRSPVKVELQSVEFLPLSADTTLAIALPNNEDVKFKYAIRLPEDIGYTNPYWLNEAGRLGMYKVEDQLLRGLPETPRALRVKFKLEIDGKPLALERPIVYKRTDPVEGEVYRPFEVIPPVFANPAEKVYLFGNHAPKEVKILLKSGKAAAEGTLTLEHPEEWRVEPTSFNFTLAQKGEEQVFTFNLYPPEEQSQVMVRPQVTMDGKTYQQEMVRIEYDHIPTQTVLRDAAIKAVKIDLKKVGDRVGYVMGAGDDIPTSLRQIGYDVTLLEDGQINAVNLERFDAVIMGVRAYNTVERLKFYQDDLLEYVKNGGTLIVQYNTSGRLTVPEEKLAPFPLKLSRERVAVEDAEVRILQPEHPVMNFPNEITEKDFEGWVQERGLYFPGEWSEEFTAILSSNDPGEPARDGGLLVAKYGEGYYIYSGYSWFRELPAGVPGAFRIFANMISLGKEARP